MTQNKDVENIIEQAKNLTEEKKITEAVELLEKSIEENPENGKLKCTLGSVYIKDLRFPKALFHLEKGHELEPEYIPGLEDLAQCYSFSNRMDDALKIYEKLIKVAPKHSFAHYEIGRGHRSKGDIDKAIDFFEKSKDLDPKNGSAWEALGTIYEAQDETNKSREYFEKAVEVDPKNFAGWASLSFSYATANEWKNSVKASEEALKLQPGTVRIMINLGTGLNRLGESDKALETLEEALKLEPKNEFALNNIGNVYRHKNNFEKALGCYQQVTDINPDSEVAWQSMIEVYTILKNKRKVKECESKRSLAKKRTGYKNEFYQNMQLFIYANKMQNQVLGQQAVKGMMIYVDLSKNWEYFDLNSTFANKIASILAPAQNQDAPHFIEMATSSVKQTKNRQLQRDILYRSARNYGALQKFDEAVSLYLEARKYTDVVIDRATEMKELQEGGDTLLFGLHGDKFYAMCTLQAANHMDPKNKGTIKMYEEAREVFSKTEDIKEYVAMVNFRLGMVYAARKEYDSSLELLEEVKRNWVENSPELIEQNNLNMQIMGIKQKMHSGKTDDYVLKVPNRDPLGDIAGLKDLFGPVTKLMMFDSSKGQEKIMKEMMELPEDERNAEDVNKRLEKPELEPLTDEAKKEKADIFIEMARVEERYGLLLRAYYDYMTAYSLLLQAKDEAKASSFLNKTKGMMQKLPYNKNELMLRLYNNVTADLIKTYPSKAIEFGNDWQKLAKKMKNVYFEAAAYFSLGQAFENNEDLPQSRENYEKALKMFEDLEDKMTLINIYRMYGDFLVRTNDETGKKYQEKSKTILDELIEAGAIQKVERDEKKIDAITGFSWKKS